MNSGEVEKAVEFMSSSRGSLIMGQALCVAIEELEKVPSTLREISNISDMKYLLTNLFPLGEAIHKGKAMHRELIDAL
jgi:hypothetical protein